MTSRGAGDDVPMLALERLRSEGLMASSWSNGPGDRYGAHRHAYDKVLVATRGSIVFHLPELDQDVALAAGDRLHLPAGTEHAATVGPGGVFCLESHLPTGTLATSPEFLSGWVHQGDENR